MLTFELNREIFCPTMTEFIISTWTVPTLLSMTVHGYNLKKARPLFGRRPKRGGWLYGFVDELPEGVVH